MEEGKSECRRRADRPPPGGKKRREEEGEEVWVVKVGLKTGAAEEREGTAEEGGAIVTRHDRDGETGGEGGCRCV